MCPSTQLAEGCVAGYRFLRFVCANLRAVTETPSAEELQSLLSLVGFLEPLSEGALGELARSAHCTGLEAGEDFIVGPEEHGERMLLLLRGQVQVCEIDTSGRELTLAVSEYGVPIGATGLASRRMREMRLRALEPSVVCYLDQRDLERIVRDNPEVGLRLARLLGGRLVSMEARWADLASKEVTGRLASMLLLLFESEGVVTSEGYRISTRYTHQQLASMIGATRETTTKALGELQESGSVEVRNGYVYITDVEALKRASG
jgi:CRP/FNR family transcriptional regulator, cyclic AMP receptor protein